MKKKPFFPKSYKLFVVWEQNFARKVSEYATLLGIDAATVTQIANDAIFAAYILQIIEIFKNELAERVNFRELLYHGRDGDVLTLTSMPTIPTIPGSPTPIAGIVKRAAKLIKKIKLHANYTTAIGQDMGIIGSVLDEDYDNLKAVIKGITPDTDQVLINWVKNRMPGVIVYSNESIPEGISDNIKWIEIGRAMRSPFEDTRKNKSSVPETRYYRIRCMYNDKPVGLHSDIIKIVSEIY